MATASPTTPEHERLFEEIRGKLDELSGSKKTQSEDLLAPQFEKMHHQMTRLTEQLGQERTSNAKLSADLAKSLESNLQLQYQIEEIKATANQTLNAEKKKWEAQKADLERSLHEVEKYAEEQKNARETMSNNAEQKLIELQMELDRKNFEIKDVKSQCAQAIAQMEAMFKENSALKNYITKITQLHKST